MNNYQNSKNEVSLDERVSLIKSRTIIFALLTKELFHGLISKTVPLIPCCLFSTAFALAIILKIDKFFFVKSHIQFLYPEKWIFYWPYFYFVVSTPFWLWAATKVGRTKQMVDRLTSVFKNASLQNNLGELPNFISDYPTSHGCRVLKVTMSHIPKDRFESSKKFLETGLHIYIDTFKENREKGIIEIHYSHNALPSLVKIEDIKAFNNFQFVIGITRTHQVVSSLRKIPHLLVAGPTQKGKSTFLRSLITTLYVNNDDLKMTLIDLKGGLEFLLFDNLARANVAANIPEAISKLTYLEDELAKRIEMFWTNKVKDIDAFHAKKDKNFTSYFKDIKWLDRHVVVVDEAAEMFLAGNHAEASEIQKARDILSKIARQGRAVGIHLIISTQRPDVKSIDSQVKANLEGVLCLPMINDASSITVLGNGRATDLPPIAGRAIWKNISEMTEVQTPLLEPAEADELLSSFRTPEKPKIKHSNETRTEVDESNVSDSEKDTQSKPPSSDNPTNDFAV